MGLFDKLFGSKQQQVTDTSSQQQGQQQGTGFSQSNLWPQISGYLGNFGNVFSPQGPNQYQTGAADAQAGLGSALAPAFQSAWNVAGQGITDADINRFSNTYDTSVINNMISDFQKQNQQTTDAQRGRMAAQGALGNKTGAEALTLQGQQGAQADAIMKARQGGFNTATGLARDNAALQLQGSGQLGQLAGVQSGINQAGFGMGQQLWQNPFAQFGQVSSAISPWAQASGQNTSYDGTSSGTSTGHNVTTGTGSPSPFEAIMTGIGTAAKAWGAFKRDGGAVKDHFADGGAVGGLGGSSFADKVRAAFDVVQGMQSGGKVDRPGFALGGWEPEITTGSLSPGDAQSVVDTATANDSSNYWNKVGDAFGGGEKKPAQPMGLDSGVDAIRGQQSGLSQFMAQTDPRQFLPKMADGGVPGIALDYEPTPWAAPRFQFDALGAGAAPQWPREVDLPPAPPVSEAFSPYGGGLASFAGAPRALDMAPPALGAAPRTEERYLGSRDDAPPSPRGPAPKTGIAGYFDRLGKTFSGEDETGWSGAGTAFLAAGIPSTQRMAAAIQNSRDSLFKRTEADRIAQMKLAEMRGLLPDSMGGGETLEARRLTQAQTQAAAQLAENKRLHDATIRASNVGADVNEQKLEELKNPMLVYDRREVVADRLGLKPGTRERSEFIATGDFPKANRDSLSVVAAEREKEAIRLGLDPTSDQGREYILTGKMKGQDLTPGQQTKVYELDDNLASAASAREAISGALALNETSYEGMGASQQAWLLSLLGPGWTPEKATNTIDMDNILRDQVLLRLKSAFGGNPTEGERKALMEVAGSVNTPAANRKKILDRALAELAKREARSQKMKEDILGRTYFKKPGAPAATQEPTTPQQPPSVPPGSAYSPSRKMWRAPDGSMYDERGNPAGAP